MSVGKSLHGRLMIATTRQINLQYSGLAVIVVEQTPESVVGMVLNDESQFTVKDIWGIVNSSKPCLRNEHVRVGGMADESLRAIHTNRKLSNMQIGKNLFLTCDRVMMDLLMASVCEKAIFFVGYSSWKLVVLKKEIEMGMWFVLPATIKNVFGQPCTTFDLGRYPKRYAATASHRDRK